MTIRLLLASGLLAAIAAEPAGAQCRLCGTAEASPDEQAEAPVQLQVETSLDFGRLVLVGPAGGIATLRPDGSRSASGAVQAPSGRVMVGTVIIHGEPGRTVWVDLPSRIALVGSNGALIELERLTTDLPGEPRLDSAGRLRFRFGGEVRVRGDVDGEFRGEVPITVQYL